MQAEEADMKEKLTMLRKEVHSAELDLKRLFNYLCCFFLFFILFHLELKKFHFLIVSCSRLKEEEAMLSNSILNQKDEIRKIADKVW